MRVDQVTGQLTVGRLATRTGVRADTVRYYEREGLLPVPQRTGGEHRRYGPADVDRLLFIRGAQRLGLRLVDAYHDLGRSAPNVVFAAVNVNQYYSRVPDVLGYSRAHQLISIPGWHFLTGPVAALRAIWRAYGVEVQAPSPDADIVHTSAVYFIGPGGTERYLAEPMADHTSSGTAYLPAGQIAAWGRGIALVARTLSS